MNKSKGNKIIFIILCFLLFLSLLPLFLTVLTSIIPQGDLFHIVKEQNVLDFETSKMFLRTKMKTIGTKNYNIIQKEENKILELKSNGSKEFGIAAFTNDLNINQVKNISLYIDTNKKFDSLKVGLKDIDENNKIISLKKFQYDDEKKLMSFNLNYDDFNDIDLKHISQIQLIFIGDENFDYIVKMDNLNLKYKFPTFLNFKDVWEENDFARYMLNSGIISFFVVVANLLFCSMVAYAFARKQFRGKEILFAVILGTMMIPPQTKIIPIFMLMQKLNLIDTYRALIYPTLVTPFGIFLMRQYIEQLPKELDEAAYVDGANDFQIFRRIVLPLSGPAIAVLGINSFIGSWNSLYMPLVLTTSKEMRTVQVGLAMFSKLNQISWPKLMAASTIVGIPVIIIFLIFQKKIISGLTAGAVKS
ncbi:MULTISPECIES: carbohydrate ABC transporter permease [Oceanotoga]|jgi:multiple sugar transport system permease protein|uniref:Multiple sugar transport system permease protein n=1 Tax=Oceanotoga teriensis TaxID=515440 RepID=A0AA45HJC3_9BACT|nr:MULTISPECIES: carbohydrate ABC transporter permease [Oceanotoga]MDN5342532.1 multiple sugar transport system permease protein [Oceanotoga sp.]MDO7977457.1 carbohydrate ABC transporter permease [Oceanotoga teriensis]PWJ95667.1 multiple sugar transport system permease protein [Oceanotoga teriensis]